MKILTALAHDLTDPEEYASVFTNDGELIIGDNGCSGRRYRPCDIKHGPV